ncbi:MAG: DNA polymerase III subunit delta' [Coriobacteriales bacterium]|nr:DNA polymerase III subunit delta' [Coriobacteriales bacterium]
MANVPLTPPALKKILNQPRVRDFLSSAFVEGRLSHAYLFLGAPGSGMLEAADALAQCVVCPNGGDASCDECVRVAHHTHPDVHHLEPGGVSGYLVSQVRELMEDVALTPVRAQSKVYIINGADKLRGASANALLKTIEEPPRGVMFILVARSADAVLPTIVSRCQQVPFRVVPPAAAVDAIQRKTGASEQEARIALSIAVTPEQASDLLASAGRRGARRAMVRVLGELKNDDAWDVINAAREICDAVRAPLEEAKGRQSAVSSDEAEYLSNKALRQIEEAHKRELTARERSGMMEVLAAAESLLRDVLVRCEEVVEPVVNEDMDDVVERLAQDASTSGVLAAIDACQSAASDIAHNVTPQLALEVMLFAIKEALE